MMSRAPKRAPARRQAMPTANERKTLDVFTILPPYKEGGKSRWVRIGSAWVNRDRSMNIKLDALPLNGELQIRKHVPREERGGGRSEGSKPLVSIRSRSSKPLDSRRRSE